MTSRAAILTIALAVALALPGPARGAAAGESDESNPYKAKLLGAPFIYYTPETKLAFGGGGVLNFRSGKKKETARPSSVWAYASYNLARQFEVMVRPEIYLDGNDLYVFGNIRYERAPQNFYGIGDDTPTSAEESFTPRTFAAQFGAKKRLVGSLFAGFQYDFEAISMEAVEEGGILDETGLTGSDGGVFSGLGVSLDWDTRDTVLFPHRGLFIQCNADAFGAVFGSDAGFTSLKFDLRTYVPFGASRVLALQARLHATGGDVPFHRLALLGSESLLRGYYKGRFRDKGLLGVQAEYRVLVSKRIGVVGFAGLAEVFPGFDEFRIENLKWSVGTGFRYVINARDGTTLRMDMAWGPACFGLYLTAKEAF
jgi:outer membrane protein assembly factor BamA